MTPIASDRPTIPRAVVPSNHNPNLLRFSALSVEGPRRQGAVRIGQLDEAERRADRDLTTDRRYTADFFENLSGTSTSEVAKKLIQPVSLLAAGIGGREDGSMGLFCLLGLTA